MPLISVPTAKPQPDAPVYSPAELNVFTLYQRPDVVAAGGVDPPDFDASQPPKHWIETDSAGTPIDGAKVYAFFDYTTGCIRPMRVLKPGQFNIPGLHTYPSYVVEPTDTTIELPNSGLLPATINPNDMCTHEEADMVASAWLEFDSTCYTVLNDMSPWIYNYPEDEKRRVWDIVFHGIPLNAALFVQAQYAMGVGAPGHWEYPGPNTGKMHPEWISEKPTEVGDPTMPSVPCPCRLLYKNESVTTAAFGTYQISKEG